MQLGETYEIRSKGDKMNLKRKNTFELAITKKKNSGT